MIQISKKELTELVNSGKKKEDIMAKYSLTSAATARLMKDCGLKFKKTHKPTYSVVDDVTPTASGVEVVNS